MLRILIGFFLLVVVLEGAIRKWLLPEYSNATFLLKDVILFAAFAAYLMQRRRNTPKSLDLGIWLIWALLVVGYVVIAGFSFESLVGMRYYLAPLPLILIVPALIQSAGDLERVAAWGVRLAIPIGILAVIQYLSPVNSPLNSYAWGGEEGSSFGVEEAGLLSGIVRPRVTATFSYISTYAAFLSATWLLAWISLLLGRSAFDRWLAGSTLILIAFNMGMNGSRALLLLAIITGLPFGIVLLRQLATFRAQVVIAGLMIFVAVVGISIFEPFALTAERGDTDEATERISAVLIMPYATFSAIELGGAGIGTTFGGYEQLGYRDFRNEFDEINLDRVGIELGVLGYFLVLTLKVLMILKVIKVYFMLPSSELRYWALAALLVQLSTYWQIPFYNSVAAIYFFSAIGLVYWLEGEAHRLKLKREQVLFPARARVKQARARG